MNTIVVPRAHARLLFLFLFAIQSLFSQTNTGAHSGSVFTTTGGGSLNFNNEGNIQSSDNSRSTATALLSVFDGTTDAIRVTGFNFSVPSGTLINGIRVEIEKSASNISLFATVSDHNVRLLKAGSEVGSNHAKSSKWTTTDTYDVYGSTSDLWGTGWTSDDINDPAFGVSFSSDIDGLITLLPSARVDHIRVTVYYTHVILPVYITEFNASSDAGNGVSASWKLVNTDQLAEVEVQGSNDAAQWTSISHSLAPASGNYTSKSISPASSYYRLRVLTIAGKNLYSTIANVRPIDNVPAIYPNPATNMIWVKRVGDSKALRCMNMHGQVYPITFVRSSESLYYADITSLQRGLYIIFDGRGNRVFNKQ